MPYFFPQYHVASRKQPNPGSDLKLLMIIIFILYCLCYKT
nr:MAG TPA: hypothetical protein [Caudoviricetes sp.]